MDRRRRLAAGLSLFVLVAAAAVLVSPRWVLERLAWLAADPVRFAVALLVLAVVRPFVAWPTTLIAVVAGYGYGLAGLPVALALIVLTSVPPYYLARRGRGSGAASAAGPWTAGAVDWGERAVDAVGDFRSVTASRLFPAPSDVVSVGAGLAGVPLLPFVAGTAVGELPWAVAGIVAGQSVGLLLREGLSAVVNLRLIAAAALAGVLVLAGPAYRHWCERRRDAA